MDVVIIIMIITSLIDDIDDITFAFTNLFNNNYLFKK